MFNARSVLALLIVTGAALAACSGNFGSGASAPGGLLPSGPLSNLPATPTPTPSAANDIVTYGDSTAFQPLPDAAGYGGAIAFEVPSPRPSGFQSVPIGATISIVAPPDTPDLNLATRGKKGEKRARRARALAYITLLATRDITLSTYPRIAVDVPRDIVTTYRENEIELALFNPAEKDKIYRLDVAEHDTESTPPPRPTGPPTALPVPTPIPVTASAAAAAASGSPVATAPASVPAGFPTGTLTPPPGAAPAASPTLPPQRILFAATAAPLKLAANVPVTFAIYALPLASPSPSPGASGSGSPAPSGSASAQPSAAASATASAAPTGSPTAAASAASASPAPTGS